MPGQNLLTALVATVLSIGSISPALAAGGATDSAVESRCAPDETWDSTMQMCMPGSDAAGRGLAVAGQFNAFGVFSALQGPRGVDQFAAPNWFMIDASRRIGTRQLLGIDLMGTAELWTYPRHGYAELLQVGEERGDGSAYIDAQHPHSSPLMGLTLSDTFSLADHRTLRLSFAPRGESGDGPVAYMHRASARDNPDAPLGHHVGQDVGHISSTVLAAQLRTGPWTLEASAFNGSEPEPTHVDLPIGALDSGALRLAYDINMDHRILASVAHVAQADPAFPGTTSAMRLSASAYDHFTLRGNWTVDHAFVLGSIQRNPAGAKLASLLDEFTATRGSTAVWGRVELLQRLGSELALANPTAPGAANDRHWISALTIGYSHWIGGRRGIEFALGSSLTADVVPEAWAHAYGSRAPLTARLIVQAHGDSRWHR